MNMELPKAAVPVRSGIKLRYGILGVVALGVIVGRKKNIKSDAKTLIEIVKTQILNAFRPPSKNLGKDILRNSNLGIRTGAARKIPIDRHFARQLLPLIRIVLPGVRSKAASLLFFHTLFLVGRTFMSLLVARLDGAIVRTIVERRLGVFCMRMAQWLLIAWPACYMNSMIRYLERKIAIEFRTNLTQYTLKKYMTNEVYYRASYLDGRLTNADQMITADVEKFCAALAHLYSHVTKPVLDLAFISYTLMARAKARGGSGYPSAAIGIGAVYLAAKMLEYFAPPFGRLVKEQAELEGEYRFQQSRVITHAEEIAFYGGEKFEVQNLSRSYLDVARHYNRLIRSQIVYHMHESFWMKYFWSACGLLMVAVPTFRNPSAESETSSARTEEFFTSRALLVNAAEAVERVMTAYKEVRELAGYTSRVRNMLAIFEELKHEKYVRPMELDEGEQSRKIKLHTAYKKGLVVEGERIAFQSVPIVNPSGDVLVKALDFCVDRGHHVLITGPNGCGKSSIFRVLGGLWPIEDGVLTKPAKSKLFYIPQRPYLPLGSLRDQITYPDHWEDAKAKGVSDEDLLEIMRWIDLEPIVEREGGFDTVKNWADVLSGGEKQRVAMARLFYHRPDFAVLDECTSAVSLAVEGGVYEKAKELGMTLLTISHRLSLLKHHAGLLKFDGLGNYEYVDASSREEASLLKWLREPIEEKKSAVGKNTVVRREPHSTPVFSVENANE